jgi:para-aminobenzoate synthetase component 1
MLGWANQFNICCYLDSNDYNSKYHHYDCLLAAGAYTFFSPSINVLAQLKEFLKQNNDWIFGHINYDLKNEIEYLTSTHPDKILFPDIFLFKPLHVVRLNKGEVVISTATERAEEIFEAISTCSLNTEFGKEAIEINSRISKSEYISIFNKIKEHILRGDCYEINFCQEFYSKDIRIDPLSIYKCLSAVSPMPFSAYYKLADKYLLCASPERYIKKTGNTVISQPIKGTYKRTKNKTQDNYYKEQLANSGKERSENVMIVDLVRNDLSKICKEGTVEVENLFEVYSFPKVHQMISTVKGILKEEVDFSDVLNATFPMGSMTGAPKKRVMELIEKYEKTKRGIYSGCIGYITDDNDFDFNVVIRSIMYNESNRYLNYQVGSGITFYSDAEKEYEECLLKAEGIKKVLQRGSTF